MALEHHPVSLSYADFLTLPPETPGEVIEGELIVGPSPFADHQRIAGTLYFLIRGILETQPAIGEAFTAPLDVVLRADAPAIVVQPDLVFVAAANLGIVGKVVVGAPDLVVEVVSPGSERTDAVRKRELYGRFGVREYWLVWPGEERIDVFTLSADGHSYGDPRTVSSGDVLTSAVLPGFELAIDRVFARKQGDADNEKKA